MESKIRIKIILEGILLILWSIVLFLAILGIFLNIHDWIRL
jgi:hypothetical protein